MTVAAAPNLVADGWALLPALLNDGAVQEIRSASESLGRERGINGCDRPNNTLVPLRWSDDVVMTALAAPGVADAVRAVTGNGDLRWTSAYLSLKDPFSGALWWHSDWWAWDHPLTRRRAAAQVAVLCYLDGTTEDTGALRLLPGTHLSSVELHALLPAAHADASVAGNADHPALRDHESQVTVPAEPGDAVVLDYRLLHATHPNSAAHVRTCLILNFAPDWSTLPPDVQAHLARGLALPVTTADRADAAKMPLAPLLPPAPDDAYGDVPLNRSAPAVYVNDS